VDKLVEKSEVDYLFVQSQPVLRAEKGGAYSYQVVVRSKKGSVRMKLESGPPGMKMSADGLLSWAVPADFANAEADVIVSVTDASSQEILHSFKIAVAK
jgi:hypothetical protein